MESSLNASMRSFGVFGGGGGGGGRNYGGGAPQRGGRPGPYDRMMGRGPPPRRDEAYSGYDDYGYGGRRAGKSTGASYSGQGHFVHMRGIPYKATESDVYDFFAPLRPINVQFIYEAGGRPSGECDVEFSVHRDAQDAMAKNNAHMGTRYVELFLKSNPGNMNKGHGNGQGHNYFSNEYDDYDYGGSGGSSGGGGGNSAFRSSRNGGFGPSGGHFVHMRGLPYKACEDDVFQFFDPIRPLSVRFTFDATGRPSGECDVEFASHRDAAEAMERNNAHMGNRYVELFMKSSPQTKGFGNGAACHVPSYSTNDY